MKPGIITTAALITLTLLAVVTGLSACLPSPERMPTATSSRPASPTESARVREPAVAGSFYSQDAEELAMMVDAFLEGVEDRGGEPIALIVPHAGYAYSGWVAAYAFKELEGTAYETIVIIAPNHHYAGFDQISVYARGGFRTPLGYIPIDEGIAQALVAADERIVFDPEVHGSEHAIEVELPFLQRIYQAFEIVPIIIGQPSEESIDVLTDALVPLLLDRRALVIASSDMSHYPSYEDANTVDTATLAAIETMNPDLVSATIRNNMNRGVPNLYTCLCGEAAVLTVMKVATRLGASHATVLRYANSADSPFVAGDKSRVVGYGSVMFWRYEPPDLTSGQKARLLEIARQSIAQHLKQQTVPEFTVHEPNLLRKSGAFVTLNLGGEQRGCIGHVLAQEPLYSTVQQAAVSAATSDVRFTPLTLEELEQVDIEISVLSPLKRVMDIEDIEVGTHGLVIVGEGKSGLLLPQVASEAGWNRRQFLQAVCHKGGLPTDAWEQGAALYSFTAIVFGEEE